MIYAKRAWTAAIAVSVITGVIASISVCGSWITVTSEGYGIITSAVELFGGYFDKNVSLWDIAGVFKHIGNNMHKSNGGIAAEHIGLGLIYVFAAYQLLLQIYFMLKLYTMKVKKHFIGGTTGIMEFMLAAASGVMPYFFCNAMANELLHLENIRVFSLGPTYYWVVTLSFLRIILMARMVFRLMPPSATADETDTGNS